MARPTPRCWPSWTPSAQRAGITPRSFSNEEIMRRYMAAMVNEGANVVHQGIALRPLDVDVTFLTATASRATAAAR
jgi:3-hydroxyacyl-CoA dehydrogenase